MMMARCHAFLMGGVAFFAVSGMAFAAPLPLGLPAGPGTSQNQFQRFQEHQRQLDSLPVPVSPETGSGPAEKASSSPSNCVIVHEIQVEGSRHIGKETIDHMTRDYKGHCLSIDDINALVNAINAEYVARGYITSRGYIPEQKLSSGILKIVIIEGKLSAIKLQGRPPRADLAMAFPGLEGKILNLRDLEQGIEQMNRLPHWGAQMRVVPGKEAGFSEVVVDAPGNGILHGQAWADNNGQSITGQEVGHSMLTAENLLGLLDMWSVEYDHALRGPDHGPRGTELFSFNGSIPFGYWTVFASASRSQDNYYLQTGTELYHLGGSQTNWRVGLSRVLLRNRIGVTTFQASFAQKGFSSEIEHTVIDAQSGHQSYVNVSLSESLKGLGGLWYITAGADIAVDAAGTDNMFPHPIRSEPHSSYVKPSLDIDGFVPITDDLSWHTSLHGEISTHDQFSTNQLQVGGPYSVRGFLNQSLIGNNGGFMRNDLSWSLPTTGLDCGPYTGFCKALFDGVQLYGIFDFGIVRAGFPPTNLPQALKGGEVVGVGGGLRKTAGPLFWNVSVTHAVHKGPLPSEGVVALFNVGVKL
ncbi:ShlB/FhaC/HecB family hemolysin secretion/activation protein [Acetobacteraceae bacterium ESL0709]|nr:ShlB/FhaC/HecB family hemolysin secretion/activation protein [Acetobacteraceae bacterium ESL0697]MDF7678059.1 ShlB/FhaC/HecB family hemolysin secretion/activation protein [Acetobacteraceae bacterium ESL0709]